MGKIGAGWLGLSDVTVPEYGWFFSKSVQKMLYSQAPNKRHVTLINYFKKIEPFCPYLGRDAYFLTQNL